MRGASRRRAVGPKERRRPDPRRRGTVEGTQIKSQRQDTAFLGDGSDAPWLTAVGKGPEKVGQSPKKGAPVVIGIEEDGVGGEGAGVVDETVMGVAA